MQIYEKIYGEYINERYGDFVLTDGQKHELAYAIQKRLTKEEIAFLLRTNKGEKTPAFSGEQMREIITAIQHNIPLDVLREHYPLKFSKEKDSDRLRFIREGIQYHYTAEQLDIIKDMDITKELYSSEIYDMYNCIMSRFPVEHLDDNYPEDETYIRVLWLGNGFCSKENGSIDITPFSKFDQEHFEVCGNIFDNKEFT